MKRRAGAVAVLAALLVVVLPPAALAKTEIHLWHAMGGQLGETVNELDTTLLINGEFGVKQIGQLAAKPTANSQGHRLGNFAQVRGAIEGEMENVFAGKKTAKEGLDAAVAKGNDILKEFAAANKP
jgi:ABC-type glycerol-3-phosphate transport system substrate-binding protein